MSAIEPRTEAPLSRSVASWAARRLGVAGRGHQLDRVALDLVVDEDLPDHVARGQDLVAGHHLVARGSPAVPA
jgi:hypothetical protein